MSALFELSLLRPLWLLLLPGILFFGVALHRRRAGAGDWGKVIDPNLMSALKSLGHVRDTGNGALAWLPLIGAGVIAVSLAGPAQEARDANSFRNLDGVVFVIDVSSSMTEDALWPQIVTMGRVGIAALGTRPAAMVVFAGDSYSASALTADTAQIGLTLTFLDNETVRDEGTRPERGLQQALQVLDDAQIVAGEVFLFTDGGGLGAEAVKMTAELVDAGARVSTVFAETENSEGRAAVEALTKIGGGIVFELDLSVAFAEHLGRSVAERLERQDYLIMFQSDYGRYLLILAMFPILALFRQRAAP